MKCPYCGKIKDKVIDSRGSDEDRVIRRRRECMSCGRRFTTYERVDKIPLMVIKKDDRREPFSREKLLTGIIKSCEKRPISMEQLEKLADRIEKNLYKYFEQEVVSSEIGEIIMQELQQLDEVAYVRFASVYRQFKDVNHFMKEIKQLLRKQDK